MALDMAKFLARFIEESREHMEKLNRGLLALERDPANPEIINAVFRSAHTIKGSARMMKLTAIGEVAHKMEDALGALREGRIGHSKAFADLLFKGLDVIAGMIDNTAAGQEIAQDNSALCEALARASEGNFHVGTSPPPVAAPPCDGSGLNEIEACSAETAGGLTGAEASINVPQLELKDVTHRTLDTIRVNSGKLDDLVKLMGEMVSNQNRLKQRLLDVKEVERIGNRTMELLFRHEDVMPQDKERQKIANESRSLYLRLKQLSSRMKDDAKAQELLTGELQEKTLAMRMVPLSSVFDSLHRMARDIAQSQGKELDILIEGGDIELDKKMTDMIGDPFIHLVRNAIDHGIEIPEERLMAGKPGRGSIKISACYDAGSVLIEFSDDGRGISTEKIGRKALQKKIFTEEELNNMPEASVIDLIFQAGFSTSAIITDLSGRGVGMDVVKRNIVEEMRGTVAVNTLEGKGTSFYIRLPMTLAIMRTLIVGVSDTQFAIANYYADEIIKVPESDIISVVDKKAIRLREEFIPVVDLGALLNLPASGKRADKASLVLIVKIGSEKLGLIVDALIDEEDMVIKSLPAHMKNIKMVAGVTVTGNNEIINVLHIPAIVEAAKQVREPRRQKEAGVLKILIVDDSINTRDIEKSILESYGYKVELAGDGLEALDKTGRIKYDLIVTDVEMPRMDGFSLTEKLRRDETYKDTPIVIVTSREKEEDKRRGIKVGADAYIVKGSFDQSNLLETVQNLIG